MPQKIDYNSISPEYNRRYNSNPLPGIRAKLFKLVEEQKPESILEIGCGTGYWLIMLSEHNCKLYGLDLSTGMLKEAKKGSPGINFVNADAFKIPLRANHFDMIICVNAVHFFPTPAQIIKNCTTLLRQNGSLSIIGYDPRNPETEWEVYKYFDCTYETDIKRYPLFEYLKDEMNKCGLQNIELELVDNVCSKKYNEDVFQDPFLQHKGCSQLAALSKDEYETGINKIKVDLEKHKSEKKDLIFSKNLFFYSLTGYNS